MYGTACDAGTSMCACTLYVCGPDVKQEFRISAMEDFLFDKKDFIAIIIDEFIGT